MEGGASGCTACGPGCNGFRAIKEAAPGRSRKWVHMAAATIGVTPIILAYLLVKGEATAHEIVRPSYRASGTVNRESFG